MRRGTTSRRKAAGSKKRDFKTAVSVTPHLQSSWKTGLQALRAEDKLHIDSEDPRRLRGSVDVDSHLQHVEPYSNRWDFAIAYQHSDRDEEVIYWTELHTASDSEVKVVIRKAKWLLNWLDGDGRALNEFECDIVWVSSGATSFTLTAPQKKQMAVAGLRHVGSYLRIRNKRG